MNKSNAPKLGNENDILIKRKYQRKINNGSLVIRTNSRSKPELTSLSFIEQLNVQKLRIYSNNQTKLKFRSSTIVELILELRVQPEMKVDDFELENLEILVLKETKLQNNQLYNLQKFLKLRSLDISNNYNIDLVHIHNVISLTYLNLSYCYLKQINQIESLVNLEELDLTQNLLKNIDSIQFLVNLKKLTADDNSGLDITTVKYQNSLENFSVQYCELKAFSTQQYFINFENIFEIIKSFTKLSNKCK
ncbi:Conserved_hypothetical protein [Hexamita inflata]|uniref:Uncharacterized protein n=1 Tax=Hexamita inflata TaxID=28002 RepID=A0AA86NV01_9EUKA|nr:Conserved hypothetical protein [Hexamita inflata]CAI9966689.1 Conserved hypothetical protein [Hexamita inflata]